MKMCTLFKINRVFSCIVLLEVTIMVIHVSFGTLDLKVNLFQAVYECCS